MLFSQLKHYLELYITDTALKVSLSLYCFTTIISHGVENYFPGCGVRVSLILFFGGLHVTNPPIRLMCPTAVCPSTFSIPDSNLKTLCPIEFKFDKEIDHHHS